MEFINHSLKSIHDRSGLYGGPNVFAARDAHPASEPRTKQNIARLHGRLMLVKSIDLHMYQPALTPVLGDFNKMVRSHTSLSHQSSFSVRSSEVAWSTGTANTSAPPPNSPELSRLNFSLCCMLSIQVSKLQPTANGFNETSCGTFCREYGCRESPKSCPPY